jgi:RimJ/RimL family protein N-acetyltransferase
MGKQLRFEAIQIDPNKLVPIHLSPLPKGAEENGIFGWTQTRTEAMEQSIGEYLLRDWRRDDAPSIAKHANNRKIWLGLRDGFPHPYDHKHAETFIERAMQSVPATLFAIATHSEAIGSIGLMIGTDVHRFTAELGYWLAEPFWGRGIMTRAVQCVTTYAIEALGLHRVYAEPYTHNVASAKVLEKAGFVCEGILQSSAFKDGTICDQFLYSFIGRTAARPGRSQRSKYPEMNND